MAHGGLRRAKDFVAVQKSIDSSVRDDLSARALRAVISRTFFPASGRHNNNNRPSAAHRARKRSAR
ncbi:hypothetical protein EMIT048CA2_10657 [Pseudomonas chlororaphis]